jgi:CheY-like chemotaxis protein
VGTARSSVQSRLVEPARRRAPVLVVESERPLRRLLGWKLSAAGFPVELVCDGRQALRWLRDHLPAVIVTSLFMPRMNGGDFMACLEREPRWRGISVIGMTRESNSILARALARSGLTVLAQPPALDELIAHLDRVADANDAR